MLRKGTSVGDQLRPVSDGKWGEGEMKELAIRVKIRRGTGHTS